MEVKINREIREYTESMFFGLSLRQFVFSIMACGIAVIAYFILRPIVGLETTSWVCIVLAIPFAIVGFLKYNGMHAEEFIWAWIKSEILSPKVLTFGETNYYYDMLKDTISKNEKETEKEPEKEIETETKADNQKDNEGGDTDDKDAN